MPRFSVILPCHNAETSLPDTLASLCTQSFPDWEAICIDDGSSDATGDILERAAARDSRIRVVRQPQSGPSASRNRGAMLALGEILHFLDADDLWHPVRLAALDRAFRSRPDAAALYTRMSLFAQDPFRPGAYSHVPEGPLDTLSLLFENPVGTASNLAVRRPVFDALGGFNARMVHNEDLEWLIRLTGTGHRLIGLDAVLLAYRASPQGLSGDLHAMRRSWHQAVAVAEALGQGPSRADLAHAEAAHLRYLARRALRLDAPWGEAVRFALAGLSTSPGGFFSAPRQATATLVGAAIQGLLPRRIRHSAFCG